MSGIGALSVPSQSSVRTPSRMKGVWFAALALLAGGCAEREDAAAAPTVWPSSSRRPRSCARPRPLLRWDWRSRWMAARASP